MSKLEPYFFVAALLIALVSLVGCAESEPSTDSDLAPTTSPTSAPATSESPDSTTPSSSADTATTGAFVAFGPPGQAEAQQADLDTEDVTFPGQAGEMTGYAARPTGEGPFQGLIVIHENRGLTDHIRDVARRFAAQGYAVLAPDMLSRVGGKERYPSDEAAVAAIGGLTQEGIIEDLRSAFDYLASRPYVTPDSIGVIGYCWGGGNSLLMGTRVSELAAGVVYYGPNPADLDSVADISAPVLGIYGEDDPRITVNVPDLKDAMQRNGKSFEFKVYPGAAHAFFNDTGQRYHEVSARDAWAVTLDFLEENLEE